MANVSTTDGALLWLISGRNCNNKGCEFRLRFRKIVACRRVLFHVRSAYIDLQVQEVDVLPFQICQLTRGAVPSSCREKSGLAPAKELQKSFSAKKKKKKGN